MNTGLDGKVGIITGGAGGLGREICLAFAREGVKTVVADMNGEAAAKLAREIEGEKGAAVSFALDVTSSRGVKDLCDFVVKRYGGIDILVNSAGITDRQPALEFPEDSFDRIIAVNLKGTFLCCQGVGRVMAEKKKGKIINMSSIGGTIGLRNTVAYCASKGGVVQITRALAVDWAQYNITVNAIAPALNNTPIARQVFQDKKTLDWFLSKIPLGRLCEPTEVASAAVFLASNAADFITGHILAVDGGWTTE
ncbi:MAG: SDR family NAD(P)-dependent oxidoreductase [Spirochaetia bacterium]|jgi:NAD(P)-dependent dehydrogenase (short-subunit alcohol dehydrogenase family)